MSFVIACPKCHAEFRSRKERELGKGVQCKDCGHQFHVSAENQVAKVDSRPNGGPPPASIRRRPEDPRPSNRKNGPDDELVDEKEASYRRRRPDDRDEYAADKDRSRPNRRRGKTVFVVLGVFGLVVILGGAAGTYFLFFAGGSGSTDDRVRPPRELPTNLLAYRPSEQASITIQNLTLMRDPECDPMQIPHLEGYFPFGHGLKPEQVEFICDMPEYRQKIRVQAISLVNPMELSTIAARCRLEPMPGSRRDLFAGNIGLQTWVVYQPDAKTVIFVSSDIKENVPREELARICKKSNEPTPLQNELLDGLTAVSGYAYVYASVPTNDERQFDVSGKVRLRSRVEESFAVRYFNSPATARKHHESEKRIWASLAAKGDPSSPSLWIRDNRTYFFQRKPLSVAPKR